jgi:hypothetical protein
VNRTSKFSKRLSIAVLLGCVALVSAAQPSDAFFKKKVKLGRPTANYAKYFDEHGIIAGTHPSDRNHFCQWKYDREDVYGEGVGVPWMQNQTQCFYYK